MASTQGFPEAKIIDESWSPGNVFLAAGQSTSRGEKSGVGHHAMLGSGAHAFDVPETQQSLRVFHRRKDGLQSRWHVTAPYSTRPLPVRLPLPAPRERDPPRPRLGRCPSDK